MFSFCLSLSCRHPPTAQQLFHSFSSRCKSSQHLPIGSISNDPVTLNKTTSAFSIFGKNNTRSEYHHTFSCTNFWRCCSFHSKAFFLCYFITNICTNTADIAEILKLTIILIHYLFSSLSLKSLV